MAADFMLDLSSDEKPALLFAHGFGQTRKAWRQTAGTLAMHGYGSLAYDARGHGESGRNEEAQAYSGVQFTDDLIIVAGELPKPPVLVDITPRWETRGFERILGFMTAHPQGFDSLDQAADAIASYLPHRTRRKTPGELRDVLRAGSDGRWRWHWDPRLIDELARDSERHQDAIAQAARAVHCPVLLVSGGRSDLVSEETVEHFRNLVPHARHEHLPAATHMVAGDDNTAFTTVVLNYLAELSAACHPGGTIQ